MKIQDNKKIKKIGLIAPSGRYNKTRLKRNIARFIEIIPSHITIEILQPTPCNPPFAYLQDSDDKQAAIFIQALRKCDILWCIRGGYGISRWADKIDWKSIVHSGFPMVTGFSDITFLHCAITANNGKSIHGPMAENIGNISKQSLQLLVNAMIYNDFPELEGRSLIHGNAKGILIGGNLTCLCHTPGTILEPAWDNAILFIEECNEELYRIDRMLTWLGSCGILQRIAGLAAGSFTGADTTRKDLAQLLQDRLKKYDIPIAIFINAGHIPDNMPLLMGERYLLNTKGKNALLQPA